MYRTAAILIATIMLGSAATAQAGSINPLGGGSNFSMQVTSIKEARFRNIVPQEYDFSCGSASVATVLKYHYGIPVTERDVFEAMWERGDQEKIRQYGFSLLDMKIYLESQGFQADGFRASLDQLIEAGIPGIGLINLNGYLHFVVIKGVDGGEVLVGDPALGMKTFTREDFESMWNGILFVITDPMPATDYAFNRASEWQVRHAAPLGSAMSRTSLAGVSLMLPRAGEF